MVWHFCWLLEVRESRICRRFQEKRGGCADRRRARRGPTRSASTCIPQRSPQESAGVKGASCSRRQRVAGERIWGSPEAMKKRWRRHPRAAHSRECLAGRGLAQGGEPSASHRRMAPVAASRGAAPPSQSPSWGRHRRLGCIAPRDEPQPPGVRPNLEVPSWRPEAKALGWPSAAIWLAGRAGRAQMLWERAERVGI